MQRIGLIGGMSWESSLHYYRLINQAVHTELGGHNSADLVMVSLNFAPLEEKLRSEAWEETGRSLLTAAEECVAAGAHMVLLCTNTMHVVSDLLESTLSVPFLHIADATSAAIAQAGVRTVGLLGTRFTMERDFYKKRLQERWGGEVLIPDSPARAEIHRIIFDELVHGTVKEESKQSYLSIMDELASRGAEGVVLGCTEIGMLVSQSDYSLPLFDTTEIHAAAAAGWALSTR